MAVIEIAHLSKDQKLELIEELWESLSQDPESVPLTAAQREELDRRLDEFEREKKAGVSPLGVPLEQALDRIRNRKK